MVKAIGKNTPPAWVSSLAGDQAGRLGVFRALYCYLTLRTEAKPAYMRTLRLVLDFRKPEHLLIKARVCIAVSHSRVMMPGGAAQTGACVFPSSALMAGLPASGREDRHHQRTPKSTKKHCRALRRNGKG
jgi:hypothetical protein